MYSSIIQMQLHIILNLYLIRQEVLSTMRPGKRPFRREGVWLKNLMKYVRSNKQATKAQQRKRGTPDIVADNTTLQNNIHTMS